MAELTVWHSIGARLAAERRRRGWTLDDVEAAGGPNYAVVRSHERGQIRTIHALERHVRAFGWSVPELFVPEARAARQAAALTDDIRALVAAYRRTTDEGRRALELIAAQLPTRRGARQGRGGGPARANELTAPGGPRRGAA